MKTLSLKLINQIIILTFIVFMAFTPKFATAANKAANEQEKEFIKITPSKGGGSLSALPTSGFKDMQTTVVNSEMKPIILSFLEFAQQLGCVAVAFGLFNLFLAFKDDNASERVKGMLSLFGGLLMISLKTIMQTAGLL